MMTLAVTNSRRNWLGWMPFPAWAEARRSGSPGPSSPVRVSLCISAVMVGSLAGRAQQESHSPALDNDVHRELTHPSTGNAADWAGATIAYRSVIGVTPGFHKPVCDKCCG